MRTIQPEPLKGVTIVRTIVLVVALINQLLVSAGYSPLPIDESNTEMIVSTIFTAAASLWAWWSNNALTRKARQAEKLAKMEGLKK